jgi:hypothetical protein
MQLGAQDWQGTSFVRRVSVTAMAPHPGTPWTENRPRCADHVQPPLGALNSRVDEQQVLRALGRDVSCISLATASSLGGFR